VALAEPVAVIRWSQLKNMRSQNTHEGHAISQESTCNVMYVANHVPHPSCDFEESCVTSRNVLQTHLPVARAERITALSKAPRLNVRGLLRPTATSRIVQVRYLEAFDPTLDYCARQSRHALYAVRSYYRLWLWLAKIQVFLPGEDIYMTMWFTTPCHD
jgi:hypothetical protein